MTRKRTADEEYQRIHDLRKDLLEADDSKLQEISESILETLRTNHIQIIESTNIEKIVCDSAASLIVLRLIC